MKHAPLVIIALLILLAAVAGCSRDERLARLAENTNAQQARQNEAVTELNLEAGENHRRVVEFIPITSTLFRSRQSRSSSRMATTRTTVNATQASVCCRRFETNIRT